MIWQICSVHYEVSRILQDEKLPSLKYHKACRYIFVLKSNLEKPEPHNQDNIETIMNDRNDIGKEVLLVRQVYSEAVVQRCSVKKVFLEISQNSQENTCARASFLIKLQASGLPLY